MNQDDQSLSVKILDKTYQIKCPPGQMQALQKASFYLDGKMRELRDTGKVVGIDRIAIITGLNLCHELLLQKQQTESDIAEMGKRIKQLQLKIEQTLQQTEPTES